MEHNLLIETIKYLGIAFASATILIVISKFILPFFLRKPVDYYNSVEREEDIELVARKKQLISDKTITFDDLDITNDDEEEPPLTSDDFDQIKQMMAIVYDEMQPDIDKELGKNSPEECKEKNE